MLYKFSGFTLNDEQKTLSFGNVQVALTKKSYQLLLYLLKNPNKPVSREDLVESVWDGRVVTENTIDQCISKLRKSLSNAQEVEYIKSIYGHGIQFVPEVKKLNLQNSSQSNKALISITLLIIIIVSAFILTKYSFFTGITDTAVVSQPQTKVKVGFLSNHKTSNPNDANAWFFDGSSRYLTEILQNNMRIATVDSKPEWLEREDKLLLAIDILNKKQAEIIVLNDFWFDGKNYHADIVLRNNDGEIGRNHFQSTKIYQLMNSVMKWFERQVDVDNQTIEQTDLIRDLSTDEYALESYLRAMSAQGVGDTKKAITYLQVAIEQDQNFNLAWYELAVSYRKQGDYKKSLAVFSSIKPSTDSLAFKLALSQGHTFDGMRQFDEAMRNYDKASSLAVQLNDEKKIASVLVSQAISAVNIENFDVGQSALDKAIQYVNVESEPHLYGIIMNTYSKLEKARNQTTKAIDYSQKSIDAFALSGNKRAEMQAKTRLASLLLREGDFEQAEELSLEALSYSKLQNQLRSVSSNHFKLAFIYQQTGRFQLAKQQWKDALELNAVLGIVDEKAAIYDYLVDLHIEFNDLETAENYLQRLLELTKVESSEAIKNISSRSELRYALAIKNIEKAEQLISEYVNVETNGLFEMFKGDLALMKNNSSEAIVNYEQALNTLENSGENVQICKIMNKLSSIYLQTDINKADINLNRAEQFKPFIYPFLKYKAMLSYKQGRKIQAVSMLEELKLKANDFWKPQDQLLLESYRE
ncbi:MAG: tetratricopeptide repeat protein [Xanthomonadales bacterium]|nr:tetratricopeptide repeat protein [Xanthomonadales bacterium]